MKKLNAFVHFPLAVFILTLPYTVYGDTNPPRGKTNPNTRYPILFRCNGALEVPCKAEVLNFATQLGCTASGVLNGPDYKEGNPNSDKTKPTPELFYELGSPDCFRATFSPNGCPSGSRINKAAKPEKKVTAKNDGPIQFKDFSITLIDDAFCKMPTFPNVANPAKPKGKTVKGLLK